MDEDWADDPFGFDWEPPPPPPPKVDPVSPKTNTNVASEQNHNDDSKKSNTSFDFNQKVLGMPLWALLLGSGTGLIILFLLL